jgi:hypothetical protein
LEKLNGKSGAYTEETYRDNYAYDEKGVDRFY